MSSVNDFGETAKGLARNPIGIIALFLVLVYAFLVVLLGAGSALTTGQRGILVWFLVVFPFVILGVFLLLVIKYPHVLYGPSDYRTDEAFLKALSQSSAALGAAKATRSQTEAIVGGESREAAEVADVAVRAFARNMARRPKERTVLWVDDRPEGNIFERQAFEASGLRIVLSGSTEDGAEKAKNRDFDAIISNVGRPGDLRAGYTLLEELRSRGDLTPFIIYSSSRKPEHIAEARAKGAFGATNRPDELYEMVMEAVG